MASYPSKKNSDLTNPLADVYGFFEESFDRRLKIMKIRFDQQEKKLNEFMEEIRATEQRSASLERDARQPRLAIEADVSSDTKTCERTEGAAAVVQAKHGDSCSAKRVQAGPTCSTSFGVKGELPALPCRDDVLVKKRQSRVSRPWRCAHHQPPGDYFPPTKPLQRRGPLFTSCLFGSTRPKRSI